MKKLYFLILLSSLCLNAQFSKVMDLTTSTLNEVYTNEFNTWNNKLFYTTHLSNNTYNINVTDGTIAGTVTLVNVPLPSDASSLTISSFKSAGNGIYIKFRYLDNVTYQYNDDLWFSDGTASNTIKILTNARINISGLETSTAVQNYQRAYQPSHVGNVFYFWKGADNNYNSSFSLWQSDGTISGTQQVTTSVHIPLDSDFVDEYWDIGLAYNGNYYFMGQDISSNLVRNKLYKLNGNSPEVLKTFNKAVRMGTVFNNKIFFIARQEMVANSGYYEREIWQTDGTVSGTINFINFTGNNAGDGVDDIDHFTFKKNANYMFIRTNDNLVHNVVVTDGNPNNLITVYAGNNYPATSFYLDDKMAYFLKQSNDTNLYDSFSIDMTDFSNRIISTPFFNTTNGFMNNGTLWIPNKTSYSSYVFTPWRTTGETTSTVNTNGYNNCTNLFMLNNILYGFSNYFNFSNLALWKFSPNFVFTNTTGNNLWSTPNNWQSKTIPLKFDNASIPASFSPQIDIPASVNNLQVSSQITITTGSMNIYGELDLQQKIKLNNGNVTLKGSNSQVINANSTNYIVTNGTGFLKAENVNLTRGLVSFPVGTVNNYNPTSILNSGVSDTFSVKVSEGISNFSNGAVNVTWDISEDVTGGSNFDLTLGWNSTQEINSFNSATAKVGHYYNNVWNEEASGSVTGSNPYTITGSGITSLSPFGVINNSALDVNAFTNSEFNIYPNPVNSELNINAKELITLVEIFDINGRKVKQENPNSFLIKINISDLVSGIYFVKVYENTNKSKSFKIVK